MDNDDELVGRVLSRREVVRLLALGGAAAAVGCRPGSGAADSSAVAGTGSPNSAILPACVVKPELTVGPYFVDRQLDRSDIRTEPTTGKVVAGTPLVLTFAVSQVANNQCVPLPGAVVDVWHCDASGAYSGVKDQMQGMDTVGQKFLRGWQRTGSNGIARFTTIFPGWYEGRAVHVHFKVRSGAATAGATGSASPGNAYEFTSQLFFPEATIDAVHARAPYAAKGRRTLTNAEDGIYQQAGDKLLVQAVPSGDGYAAQFALALDLSDTKVGGADSLGGPGGPGSPPPGGRPFSPPPGGQRPPAGRTR